MPSIRDIAAIGLTFSLTTFAWIFFRAESIGHAFRYISGIFSTSLFLRPEVFPLDVVAVTTLFILLEWQGREQPYAIAELGFGWPRPARWAMYYGLCIAITAMAGEQQQFIYFQF